MIWEKIKEQGYGLATLGVLTSNLVIFIIIATRGVAKIWEPTRWILFTEVTLCAGLILWGIERYVKDWQKK